MPESRTIRKRSVRTLMGLPLYDIASGPDMARGESKGHAKGVIAIGDVATGWIAIGGQARGGVAIGGMAAGVVAIGGLAAGAVCVGGVALALGFALGGVAIAPIAIGGVAIGGEVEGGKTIKVGQSTKPGPAGRLGRRSEALAFRSR